ncbi:MAG: alpha/beta fold hydrolase [Betaproteobacteria bacterium]
MDSKTIQLGNTQYAYYEMANPGKPKMLLLHGMVVESHCFEKLAAFFKDDYHLLFLDLKGHGKSGNGTSYDESYTNDAIARDFLAFYQAVIQEPFHLVGYSLGGQYAIKFAGTFPDKVKSLVLIDSAPELSFKGNLAILFALMKTPKFFKDEAHVYRYYDVRNPGMGDYMLKYCLARDSFGHYTPRYDKLNFAPNTMAKAAARGKDLWEASCRITAPTLLLRGGKSFVFSNRLEKKMRMSIPRLEVVLLKDEEHLMAITHPKEVAEPIRAFLAKV